MQLHIVLTFFSVEYLPAGDRKSSEHVGVLLYGYSHLHLAIVHLLQ